MTVCIAAVCGQGESSRAVVAADRLVTSGGYMEFEHNGSKIVDLDDRALVMVAGDTNEGMRLVRLAAGNVDDLESIEAIATDLGDRYAQQRLQRAEQAILRSRGLDLQSFYANHQALNQEVVMLADNALANWGLGVELLLAGVDAEGAHIFTNGDPGGGSTDHGPIGWTAIGSGAVHVIPAMAGFEHGPGADYKETLYRVYAAKRRAEVAPGVGHETDVAVIAQSGIKRLSKQEMANLDSIYEENLSKTAEELQKQLDGFHPEDGEDDGES